jgi:hypothetical protein
MPLITKLAQPITWKQLEIELNHQQWLFKTNRLGYWQWQHSHFSTPRQSKLIFHQSLIEKWHLTFKWLETTYKHHRMLSRTAEVLLVDVTSGPWSTLVTKMDISLELDNHWSYFKSINSTYIKVRWWQSEVHPPLAVESLLY